MVNHDHLVDIAHLGRTPLGKNHLYLLAVMVPACLGLRPMSHDKRLKQGVAGKAIGPVEPGAGNLPHGEETAQGGLPIEIGLHAPALVMGGRNYRDRLLRDIDTEAKTRLVNRREALADELGRLVRDIEENTCVARALHLGIDGAGDDVTGRKLETLVVFLHEANPMGIFQDPTLPAHGLGD